MFFPLSQGLTEMPVSNESVNVNAIIGKSTEQATEIAIRAEGFTEQEVPASLTWPVIRPHVVKFGESTRGISEKFAFATYQANVMSLLVRLLDGMHAELKPKGK